MACHELSALRIALGELLEKEAHDLAHEREELAPILEGRPEIRRLAEAKTLPALEAALREALLRLEEKAAEEEEPYWRGLLLASEAALARLQALRREVEAFYQDLDSLHHRLHRLFPRRRG
ncbi:hypothetical protein QT17_03960 [Thermus sp. 2.9]|uniref:DUF3209 family protein n=1 Tax=Thermus sp. (strain 2.9) TaxID=1577051 RepID=UPI000543F245|nr:DUF3209 family protein [Thermus sp. 2.9]KHG65912.1 hypothetical protein QT17_03960 [Thermus sp. 2.9]